MAIHENLSASFVGPGRRKLMTIRYGHELGNGSTLYGQSITRKYHDVPLQFQGINRGGSTISPSFVADDHPMVVVTIGQFFMIKGIAVPGGTKLRHFVKL